LAIATDCLFGRIIGIHQGLFSARIKLVPVHLNFMGEVRVLYDHGPHLGRCVAEKAVIPKPRLTTSMLACESKVRPRGEVRFERTTPADNPAAKTTGALNGDSEPKG
jgi:hypothetical protein